jgi:hypothetical protein
VRHVKQQDSGISVCGAGVGDGDELVLGALHSDCDDCRAELKIAPCADKGNEPRPVPTWEPSPYLAARKISFDTIMCSHCLREVLSLAPITLPDGQVARHCGCLARGE